MLQNGVKKSWSVPSLIATLSINKNMIMSQIQRVALLLNYEQFNRWESGTWVSSCHFAPLSTGHVIDVVEDILLDNGGTLHAGDRAIVTTICKEHVELKFGDNVVEVSRGRCDHLRG